MSLYRAEEDFPRLDQFVAERENLTRSYVKTLIDGGHITLNGQVVRAGKPIKKGDQVEVVLPPVRTLSTLPEDIPVEIVYEDEDLAVINKPQGMTVHPAAGSPSGTLVNALLFRLDKLSGINGTLRPGIVHRLDKNTSGLLVVAKNDQAHLDLSGQIARKECRRVYRALVQGRVREDEGEISAPVGRSPRDRKKMAVVENGRPAQTAFRVLQRLGNYTYMEFSLKTGRTHQIRVHCKHIGHPVVGDDVYNPTNCPFGLKGQLLHAWSLSFVHPRTQERMTFYAPLPGDFARVLSLLRRKEGLPEEDGADKIPE